MDYSNIQTQTIKSLTEQEQEYLQLAKELALISKYENIIKATGSNYNIFRVLRIENKEVITHSRMIADLLNPNGWHGMGSKFLSLFFQTLAPDIEKPENLESVECTTEKNYGPIDDTAIKGGNVDIILEGLDTLHNTPLLIENKIGAGDQENQLLRYYNQFNGKCDLYYLTLFGDLPSEGSTGGKDLGIKTISYSKHILEWLEKCHPLSIDKPLLRETLKQYINIVKILTKQSMNDEKDKEIFDFIEKNKGSLKGLYTQMGNFVNNHLNNRIQEIYKEITENNETLMKSLKAEDVSKKDDYHYHFKFGNKGETGVVFQLSIHELSLFTNAWRWTEVDTYGEDPKLIEALGGEGKMYYEGRLDSRKPTEELAKEVVRGIEATREYYNSLLKLKPNE